jgi:hypothetical protein
VSLVASERLKIEGNCLQNKLVFNVNRGEHPSYNCRGDVDKESVTQQW